MNYRTVPEAQNRLKLGRTIAALVVCLAAVAVATGCASTKYTSQEKLTGERLPRPNQVLVFDFAATASDVPPDSMLAREYTVAATPQSAHEIAVGRELGSQIAKRLAEEIREMGLPTQNAARGTQPQLNDIIIRGYLVGIEEGSTAKRVVIGFGAGKTELITAVEGLQMTAQGLRKLGGGTVKSGGGSKAGTAVGAATWAATANPAGFIVNTSRHLYGEVSGSSKVEGRAKATAKEIADVVKTRFREQGWIN